MSLKIALFDRSHTSFYWRSIVTMALSYTVSEIKRDIGRKSFLSHPMHSTPLLGARVEIFS